MEQKTKTTAKDFFLCLGSTVGVYVSSIAFLILAFQIIDRIFPLADEYLGGSDGIIRTNIAILVVFFPTLLYLLWLGIKELQKHPEKKDIWVRKWMAFFTLFVSGLTVVIDLAILVYQFLGAEDLTLRFFLKVIVVFALAATIFRSSLSNLKREDFSKIKDIKLRMSLVSFFFLAAIIYGFILIGSPAMQRAKNLDTTRVNDLASLQNQIVYTQWENKGTVPNTLDALNDPITGFTVPTDPATSASYGYTKISKNSFELCANFETTSNTNPTDTMYVGSLTDTNWQHDATTTCFTRTIDPSLYKVSPAPAVK